MSQLNVDTIQNRAGTGGPTLPSLTVTNNVNVAGLVTAPTFIGDLNGNAVYASTAGVSTYASTAGVSTLSQGLDGTPNVSVGILTSVDFRVKTVSEELKVGVANSVTINYSAGDGNIGIITNPSGPISLYVTNIPTTNFNNKLLSYTIIVNQSSVGYSCSSVYFNNIEQDLKWVGGSVSSGSTNAIDYFNFVGIDTIGNGSVFSYTVTANLNGDYRFY